MSSNLIDLAFYRSQHEALVPIALLESHEISVVIKNEHSATICEPISIINGGVILQVDSIQETDARKILSESNLIDYDGLFFDQVENTYVPNTYALSVVKIVLLIYLIPLLILCGIHL